MGFKPSQWLVELKSKSKDKASTCSPHSIKSS
jgi:hypothetical protein